MILNTNSSNVEYLDGKRHYFKQKKTSLFGSETPRVSQDKPNDAKLRVNVNEENILSQFEILRKERETNEMKSKFATDKTPKETEMYTPWSKSSASATNMNYSQEQSEMRPNWPYEQNSQKFSGEKKSSEESYPGFAPGFGAGNLRTNSRMKSEVGSHGAMITEKKQNEFYPFGSYSGGSNLIADSNQYKVETNKIRDEERNDRYDSRRVTEYESNALYQEAENRAKLRGLDRKRDSYETYDKNYEYSESADNFNAANNVAYNLGKQEVFRGPLLQNDSKRVGSSSTHNDYRHYSLDEFMNSRQQLMNPIQLKRTTLSGSEDVNQADNFMGNEDNNSSLKQYYGTNTFDTIFPSDRIVSATKANGPYSMKAPYATD